MFPRYLYLLYPLMSILTFIIFALDKQAAIHARRRWSERTLHTLEFLCGWPGALAAMLILRHKNQKPLYILTFIIITILNVLLFALLLPI